MVLPCPQYYARRCEISSPTHLQSRTAVRNTRGASKTAHLDKAGSVTVTDTFPITSTPLTDLALMGGLHERLVNALAGDDSERAAAVAGQDLVEHGINEVLARHGGWDGWEADDIVGPILDQVEDGLVNLTPHAVAVYADDQPIVSVPASGVVARLDEMTTADGVIAGIPAVTVDLGNVTGLPVPAEGATYIVSMPTLMGLAAAGSRPDCYYPFGQVRDDRGRIIGCRSLARVPTPTTTLKIDSLD